MVMAMEKGMRARMACSFKEGMSRDEDIHVLVLGIRSIGHVARAMPCKATGCPRRRTGLQNRKVRLWRNATDDVPGAHPTHTSMRYRYNSLSVRVLVWMWFKVHLDHTIPHRVCTRIMGSQRLSIFDDGSNQGRTRMCSKPFAKYVIAYRTEDIHIVLCSALLNLQLPGTSSSTRIHTRHQIRLVQHHAPKQNPLPQTLPLLTLLITSSPLFLETPRTRNPIQRRTFVLIDESIQ